MASCPIPRMLGLNSVLLPILQGLTRHDREIYVLLLFQSVPNSVTCYETRFTPPLIQGWVRRGSRRGTFLELTSVILSRSFHP